MPWTGTTPDHLRVPASNVQCQCGTTRRKGSREVSQSLMRMSNRVAPRRPKFPKGKVGVCDEEQGHGEDS